MLYISVCGSIIIIHCHLSLYFNLMMDFVCDHNSAKRSHVPKHSQNGISSESFTNRELATLAIGCRHALCKKIYI